MISKSTILQAILDELGRELELLADASRAMHEDASHEQNRAEDKYDTRGLETSYLASSQARHATATEEALAAYQSLKLTTFTKATPIDLTALVEAQSSTETTLYFIGPKAGGVEVRVGKREIVVVTPESPIGKLLIGKKAGDTFSFLTRGPAQPVKILSVR
jgi:transcription elongation GreA/GreB family factor